MPARRFPPPWSGFFSVPLVTEGIAEKQYSYCANLVSSIERGDGMNSATDFSATTSLSATTSQRSRTAAYFWVALALFGLAIIGCGVAGSYYTNIMDAPYVGP
jgi:hypothetical protein